MTRPCVAVCAIMRDEVSYLLEWVAYYRVIGFDKIIIYDHQSKDGLSEMCRDLAAAGLIHYVPWTDQPGELNAQLPAYRHAAAHFGADWLACLDADEFLCFESAGSVHEFLAAAGKDGMPIALNWKNFGSGGAMTRSPGLVIERFVRRCGPDQKGTTHIKTLGPVTALAAGATLHVHGWPLAPGQHYVDACGRPIEVSQHTYVEPPVWRCAWINHYIVKSREEFAAKARRGRVDRPDQHPEKLSQNFANYFEPLDCNDSEDLVIQRFTPRVLAEVRRLEDVLVTVRAASAPEASPAATCSVGCHDAMGEVILRRVRDVVFEGSAYAGFDPEPWPDDLQGWGSDHPILLRAIDAIRPRSILEVGSWKGRSAINMARHAASLGLDCETVCVDTWLGSHEHWMRNQPGWFESLQIKFGQPQLYFTFLANVMRAGLQGSITPFPCSSETALAVLRDRGFYFDLCYVDAAHEYDSVLRDLRACWPVLSEPGVLIGDDYTWPGVKAAADAFAREVGATIQEDAEKYLIVKGRATFPI